MKRQLIIFAFLLSTNLVFSQNKEKADKLVEEGIAYHDKGDFEGAIVRYDKALEADKDNLNALAEKAMSLISIQKYDESIALCQRAIEKHQGEDLKTVYVTYGNAYDALKKTDKSLEVYEEGINLYPDFYQLHFNKGITLSSVSKYDDAILSFQKSVSLNPKHASSHNAIARLMAVKDNRIASILAFSRFLILEPKSNRSIDNLELLKKNMMGNVEKTGKKSVTINISSDLLADSTADGKPKENSFAMTDMILSMTSALDYDKKFKNQTEVEKFKRKMETICSSLKEGQKDGYGFYWEFYVPYFVEMHEQNLVEIFSYIAFASSDDPSVAKWIKTHDNEIDRFYEWSKSYPWKKN